MCCGQFGVDGDVQLRFLAGICSSIMHLKKFQPSDWEEVMKYLAVLVGAQTAKTLTERYVDENHCFFLNHLYFNRIFHLSLVFALLART